MRDDYNIKEMQARLKRYIDEDRYYHTLGVMYTCASLAMVYDYENMKRAQVAGLLHDCAKCIPNKKKLKLCEKANIAVRPVERNNPFLLHAKLGAYIARKKYDVYDDEILSAIACHTTGKPNMTLLEKILFIADYIEPGRYKADNLEQIRKLAYEDLDICVYAILKDTLGYLQATPGDIDAETEESYSYYANLFYEKTGEKN